MASVGLSFVRGKYVFVNLTRASFQSSIQCTAFLSYNSKQALRRKEIRITKDEGTNTNNSELSTPENNQQVIHLENKKIVDNFSLPKPDDMYKNNKNLISLYTKFRTRKHREKSGKILLEGKSLIEHALDSGIVLETLFFSKEKAFASLSTDSLEGVEILKVHDSTFQICNSHGASPEIVGVCKKPALNYFENNADNALPVTVLCTNIRDPENMGAIVMIAAATGCRNILLTKGCVDVWDRKVLETASGAHFRIPIINNINWSDLQNHISKSSTFYIADNATELDLEDSQIYFEEDRQNDTSNHCTQLPVSDDNVEVATYDIKENQLQKYEEIALPCHLYSTVGFPKKEIVLYVGGETEGIDPRIEILANELKGQRIKIPLENGVDSLNVSSALTVILYEIKRQFAEKYVSMM